MRRVTFLIVALLVAVVAQAQSIRKVEGVVVDKKSKDPLYGANVCLISKLDPDLSYCMACDANGAYTLTAVPYGDYTLRVSYIGYKTEETAVELTATKNNKLAYITLSEDAVLLGSVEVKGRATRAEQKGDSLVYSAEAFKVIEGSTAEELLSKMPGIVVEGGTVQAQGEEVKKVYVDGKEFFDGDVNLALKNLPSDIISNIEVFDKMSEQAEFTGFDDGNSQKTINIVTKGGIVKGAFGKLYAGGGADIEGDARYNAGGNYNYFEGDRRISILGLANNVNIQNFSQDDISGVMAASSGGGGRGPGGGGGGRGPGSGSDASTFMVGSMGGVTTSQAAGLNYVDMLGEKLKVTGSYFFNHSINDRDVSSDLDYFETSLLGKSYKELSLSDMDNYNHRINLRLDYDFSEKSKLNIKPRLSFQDNQSVSYMLGENLYNDQQTMTSETNTSTQTNAYNMGLDVTYRQAFDRIGQSLSVSMSGSLVHNEGNTFYDYLTKVFEDKITETSESQNKISLTHQTSYQGNLAYTDRLTDNMMLMANYRVSYSDESSDKETYNKSSVTDLYDQLNESLSNVFVSNYITQAAGANLMYKTDNLRLSGGVSLQYATLASEQEYPRVDTTHNNFLSLLPSMMMDYKINSGNSLRLFYRSNSMAPSVTNLQDVIDNDNPLMLSSGNPDLEQQISHMSTLRYTRTLTSGQTFIAMLGGTIRDNYVADSSYIATEDVELAPGIILNKGAQYTRPVNLDGYYSLQGMVTYGFPVDLIRSNINLSLSANYANVPNVFDGVENKVTELNLIPKIVIGSNISDKLDFTLSYSAGVNIAESTLTGSTTDQYMNHSAQGKFGWIFGNGFTLGSTFNYIGYTGLDEDLNYYLWNASVGKKFMKNDAAEIKLEVLDILQQNQAFSRTVGSNYYQYTTSNVLQPYVMLSFVYTLKPNISLPKNNRSSHMPPMDRM